MSHAPHELSAGVELVAAELGRLGLLEAGPGCRISPFALFIPVDEEGTCRPIRLGAGCRIDGLAIVHGGAELGEGTVIEAGTIVGKPEQGYALGQTYSGSGAPTVIGGGAVLRSGAVLYAGVRVGSESMVGHHTLLRTNVQVGTGTLLGHNLTVERDTRIGDQVRCSPGSHITSSTVLADRVFLGAGVVTVNDKTLTWRDPDQPDPLLVPPRFEFGARVGSGSRILGGVVIGARALVGAGSVVTRDVEPGTVVYGVPARPAGRCHE